MKIIASFQNHLKQSPVDSCTDSKIRTKKIIDNKKIAALSIKISSDVSVKLEEIETATKQETYIKLPVKQKVIENEKESQINVMAPVKSIEKPLEIRKSSENNKKMTQTKADITPSKIQCAESPVTNEPSQDEKQAEKNKSLEEKVSGSCQSD